MEIWSAPWRSDIVFDGSRYGKRVDGRFRFRGGRSEAFYGPNVGNLLARTPTEETGDASSPSAWALGGTSSQDGTEPSSLRRSLSWLDACPSGAEFAIEAHAYGMNGRNGAPGDPKAITLGSSDVVFVNAGGRSARSINHHRIRQLLDCMEGKRADGTANPNWPTLRYLVSSTDHPPIGRGSSCAQTRSDAPDRDEDLDMYSRRPSHNGGSGGSSALLVGYNVDTGLGEIDLRPLGSMHVGGGRGATGDGSGGCRAWIQPGPTDAMAAAAAEAVQSIAAEIVWPPVSLQHSRPSLPLSSERGGEGLEVPVS